MTAGGDANVDWRTLMLERHALPERYLESARRWFDPLVQALAQSQSESGLPMLVAVNGSQGSGKTTLTDYLRESLVAEYGLRAVALSLDDFYLTRDERMQRASDFHPLFATRGVPGTHDMSLLIATLEQLLGRKSQGNPLPEPVRVPRFDKHRDDRAPAAEWDVIEPVLDVVLLEGWCLGAIAEDEASLVEPLNALEADEDSDGSWRRSCNTALIDQFYPLYGMVDQWIMLCAPSFDCVFRWRQEQEKKLAARVAHAQQIRLMNDVQLARFIQHYERITRHCLSTLPDCVHHLFVLDEDRAIRSYRHTASPVPLVRSRSG